MSWSRGPEESGLEPDVRAGNGLYTVQSPSPRQAEHGLYPAHGTEHKEAVPPLPAYAINDKNNDLNSHEAPKYIAEKQQIYSNAPLPPLPPKSRKKLWIILGVVAAIILIIVLVVPLAVLLPRRNGSGSSSDSASGSSGPDNSEDSTGANPVPDPVQQIRSVQGAYNGTGLTAIPPFHSREAMWLFWQDYTGDIRLSRMNEAGNWIPNSESVGIRDAVNGTGLASLSHFSGPTNIPINHLVYIDTDLMLTDLIMINGSGNWQDGGLRSQNLSIPASPSATQPSHLSYNAGRGTLSYLYASGSLGNLNELTYDHEDRVWGNRFIFDETNGYGGVVVQITDDRNLTTVYVQQLPGENSSGDAGGSGGEGDGGGEGGGLGMYYRDLATSSPSFVRGPDANDAGVYPNSSMTAPVGGPDADLVYYQDRSSGEITARRVQGERSDARWMEETSLGIVAMPGSALFAVGMPVPVGSDNIETQLFFQVDGDDVRQYSGTRFGFEEVGVVPLSTD